MSQKHDWNSVEIRKLVQHTIASGKEPKSLRSYRTNPWRDIETGVHFADAVMAEYLAAWQRRKPNSSQNRITLLYLKRIKETVVRLSYEEVVELGRVCFRLWSNGEIAPIIGVTLFGTERGETERAVQGISLLIGACLRLSYYSMEESPEERGSTTLGLGLFFTGILYGSRDQRTFTWDNFLEAVTRRNSKAVAAFQDLLLIHANIGQMAWAPFNPPPSPSRSTPWIMQMNLQDLMSLVGSPNEFIPLPLPNPYVSPIMEMVREYNKILAERLIAPKTLLDWFIGRREEFNYLTTAMWEDILQRPHYGLRSGGQDRIQLKLAAFEKRDLTYEAIQLSPVKEFPLARVKCWMRFRGDLISQSFDFGPNFCSLRENPGWDLAHELQRAEDELILFLATQAYWEIVMGRGVVDKSSSSVEQRIESTKRQLRERIVPVRPHFRLLPPGAHASVEAETAAREILGVSALPQNKTFVREHERGWREAQEIPPLFTYTEEDVKNWST